MLSILLFIFFAGIWGAVILPHYEVFKYSGNFLKVVLLSPNSQQIPVLAQMNTVQTWFALKDCRGAVCEAIQPNYVNSEPFLSLFKCPALYQCNSVGYGKPTIQPLIVDLVQSFGTISLVVLALDSLNRLYPTSQPGTTNDPAAGVVGLGPICCESPLINDYDIGNQSASLLQALFKKQYATGYELQSFAFSRSVTAWGTVYGFQNIFAQFAGINLSPSDLIPIVPGSCCWTFTISSAVKVYNSAEIDDSRILQQVPKPASITYDPSMDFNIVSAEMADAYATAFNNLNQGSLKAVCEDVGDVVAYRYGFVSGTFPIFPALSFNAITADGATTVFNFVGQQGVAYVDPSSIQIKVFLPFAFPKRNPCPDQWILGNPAINNGVEPQSTGLNNYYFPLMVTKGTADGIQQYYIALKGQIL